MQTSFLNDASVTRWFGFLYLNHQSHGACRTKTQVIAGTYRNVPRKSYERQAFVAISSRSSRDRHFADRRTWNDAGRPGSGLLDCRRGSHPKDGADNQTLQPRSWPPLLLVSRLPSSSFAAERAMWLLSCFLRQPLQAADRGSRGQQSRRWPSHGDRFEPDRGTDPRPRLQAARSCPRDGRLPRSPPRAATRAAGLCCFE